MPDACSASFGSKMVDEGTSRSIRETWVQARSAYGKPGAV